MMAETLGTDGQAPYREFLANLWDFVKIKYHILYNMISSLPIYGIIFNNLIKKFIDNI